MQSILGNNTRKPDIIFSSTGRIDITARIAKHLELSRGDVVDVMVDDSEYYLYVKRRSPVSGRYEAMVFPSNKRGNHFRAYSRRLCAAVLRASGAAETARLCVGPPVDSIYGTLLPIIIKLLL